MKIVILTVNHIYANKLVKDILQKYTNDVKLIIEPKVLLKNKNFFQTIIHYIKVSGFKYLYFQSLKLIIYKILSFIVTNLSSGVNNRFYSFNRIANTLKINRLKVLDINSINVIRKINKINPDIVVSVLFPQIIKSDLLNLVKNKIINFHPAYLPNYRGISPIFWSILNKEKYIGYTIHYINKGIDLGEIIFQKKIKLLPFDTEDSAYRRCVELGSFDLIDIINSFDNKKPIGVIKKGGSYYSFPDKKSVDRFLKRGYKFYNLRQFIWY